MIHGGKLDDVPTIDLSLLRRNSANRSLVIQKIREASHRYGFFHIINHGVPDSTIEEALNVNAKFFEMPMAAKEELISDDINKVVRLGHLQVDDYSRDFLKLQAHPLDHLVHYWPRSPPDYREKMGMYSRGARKVCIELFGAIMESLNLDQTHDLQQKFEQGIQILGINCYPSNTKSGAFPHTDHSIITLLLQSASGLQVDDEGSWKNVPELKDSLQVFVGDHLEVISNGLYKSVKHRVLVSGCSNTRLSIASFHSLAMDDVVEPVVAEELSRRYRGSTLADYFKHLGDGNKRAFIETLKL